MILDLPRTGLFLMASVMLLGSPGPGIAALLAVGRERGFARGMRFFWGLQAGLALAVALCAAGLFSVIEAIPHALTAMAIIGVLYLIYLALRIATAPVGAFAAGRARTASASARAGFLLGVTNPKSYLAFLSLLASYVLLPGRPTGDAMLKWLLCIFVMILVDGGWLWAGAVAGRARLSEKAEKAMNYVMGSAILVAAGLSLL